MVIKDEMQQIVEVEIKDKQEESKPLQDTIQNTANAFFAEVAAA